MLANIFLAVIGVLAWAHARGVWERLEGRTAWSLFDYVCHSWRFGGVMLLDVGVPNLVRPDRAKAPAGARTSSWLVATAVFLVVLVRAVWIASGGEDRIVVNVPDDAFYYLVLAKHHATLGRWTFDGIAPATGFHLLWGYALSGLYRLNPAWTLPQIFWIASAIGATCFALSAWTLMRLLHPRLGPAAIAAILVVFVGGRYLLLPTMAMETPLVVLLATLAAYVTLNNNYPRGDVARICAAPFAIGLTGELARSDFGVVPAALVAAVLLTTARRSNYFHDPRVQVAVATLCGAVVGLAISFGHNYSVSGQLLQNSVLMKAHWSAVTEPSLSSILLLIGDVFAFGLLGSKVGFALFIGIAVTAVTHMLRTKRNSDLLIAATLITVAYAIVYRKNSQAMQVWYLASFVLPSVIYLALAVQAASQALPRLAVEATLFGAAVVNVYMSFYPVWITQIINAEAGRELAAHRAVVGTWNAGLVGYYNYDRTVNLDGLANDEILPFVADGRLLDYIRFRRLRIVADFEAMLNEVHSRRGGYSDGKLAMCLVPTKTIQVPNVRPWLGKPYRLFAVKC